MLSFSIIATKTFTAIVHPWFQRQNASRALARQPWSQGSTLTFDITSLTVNDILDVIGQNFVPSQALILARSNNSRIICNTCKHNGSDSLKCFVTSNLSGQQSRIFLKRPLGLLRLSWENIEVPRSYCKNCREFFTVRRCGNVSKAKQLSP